MVDLLGTILFFVLAAGSLGLPIFFVGTLAGGVIMGDHKALIVSGISGGLCFVLYKVLSALYENNVLDVIEMIRG